MPQTKAYSRKFTLKLTNPHTGEILYDGPGHTNDPAMKTVMRQYTPFQLNIEIDGQPVSLEDILSRLVPAELARQVEAMLIEQLSADAPFRFRGNELVN